MTEQTVLHLKSYYIIKWQCKIYYLLRLIIICETH
jgi:hypothetical protein